MTLFSARHGFQAVAMLQGREGSEGTVGEDAERGAEPEGRGSKQGAEEEGRRGREREEVEGDDSRARAQSFQTKR